MALSIWRNEQDVSDSDAETGGKKRRKEENMFGQREGERIEDRKGRMSYSEDMWMGKLLREKFFPLGTISMENCDTTYYLYMCCQKSNG